MRESAQQNSHRAPGPATLILWALALIAAAALIAARLSRGPAPDIERWLFLIPLQPLITATIIGIFRKRLPKTLVTVLGVGSVGLSFVLAVVLFVHIKLTGAVLSQTLFSWISSGSLNIDLAFTLDPLSGVMALVVTGVGSLIHLYSVGYMAHDEDYARYFSYLNLFTAAMLTLVLGDSLPVMFIGWEGVGLCSYLLIGFWFTDAAKAKAGKKAFIVNRIGDVGFVIAMLFLFLNAGTLEFSALSDSMHKFTPAMATAIALLLFFGATGKSAQIPLYVWLPDAMAGPTPVSALIHAATMVTAGVYMIARMHFLYVAAPTAMMVVAIVGAATALFAATIGLFQYDIKKVLAYSTVSQLGFMFLGVGVGAFIAAIFHLMTHAFFKACLFLGSGSVIHGMHEEQDIRKMGGLQTLMPITAKTFFISCVAIAGIPPLSAFFSKDAILFHAFALHYGSPAWLGVTLWALALLAAFFTSFYIFRLYYMTFTGECRAPQEIKEKGIHESPWTMTLPLVVLAALAAIGGLIGMPEHAFHVPDLFTRNLEMTFDKAYRATGIPHAGVTLEFILMGVSTLVAAIGWGLARALYKDAKSETPARMKERFAGVFKVVYNKYYVDEAYEASVIKPTVGFATFLWRIVDTYLVDGFLVRLSAFLVRTMGEGVRLVQTGNVQTYLLAFLIGVAAIMFYMWQGAAV